MELQNHTPFSADLFRGVIDEQRLFGSLAVRVTYDLADGRLVVAKEQKWKISPGPWECEYGPMAGDELFYRGGVDLFVFGQAWAPQGGKITQSEVVVQVGASFRYAIAVFGDRVWQQRNADLVPSVPQPFAAVPLTVENAFGGKDEWDELPIPYPDNPDGKGYYMTAESAAGKPLPNLESPEHIIRRWDDHPDPVGVGRRPMAFGPHLRKSLAFDMRSGALKKLDPAFFNAAFPGMVAPRVAEGDAVRVRGVSAAGDVAFTIPPSGLRMRLGFGAQFSEHVPPIDQIGVEADHSRVFITYRYPFRYGLVPLEKRSCELFWDGRGDAS